MTAIKAIVLDLDGTLLNSDKSISPRNAHAVKQCFASGIPIIIATARPPRTATRFVEELPFLDHMIFYNGALVICKSKQTQRHIRIPTEISEQIVKFLELHAPEGFLSYEVNDSWYTSTPVPESQRAALGIRSNDPSPEIVDQPFIRSLSPTKILVLGYSKWQDLLEPFHDQVNVIATDGGALVQIMPKIASKENAVQTVIQELGVNMENVMVFGDDYNDLGLFQICGFSIAMGNAIPELKKCAKYITETNDNDGVALALEKLVL